MTYPTKLSLLNQTIELEPEDVVITDPEQGSDGYYYREFRFYGEAASEGGQLPLVLTVRVKSLDQTKVQATAPAQEF